MEGAIRDLDAAHALVPRWAVDAVRTDAERAIHTRLARRLSHPCCVLALCPVAVVTRAVVRRVACTGLTLSGRTDRLRAACRAAAVRPEARRAAR